MLPSQLLHITLTYGSPLYIYDTATIKQQYSTLTQAFEHTNARFFYACKALTNISILKYIRSLGCSIDCSSIVEVQLALHAGYLPSQVLYTTNGISFEEIQQAVAYGVHVNIDSLSNLAKFGATYGNSYPVGVRLRPNIMAGGNLKIATGHSKSKFGIPVTQLQELLAIHHKYNLHVYALHVHTGSEIKDINTFVQVIDVLGGIVPHFEQLQVLDLGGGFKVAYKHGEQATDIALLSQEVYKAIHALEQRVGKQLQVWFEPGKYMVSSCGYLCTQVTVVKHTHNMSFASVNSGFNHLIRPMMYDAYHYIQNISNPTGVHKLYTITGNLCETDNFATDRSIAEVSEGDILAIHNAGAYGFEMASNYNSRYKPAEVMYYNGEAQLIREADTFDDLLRKQVIIDDEVLS